MRKLRVAVIGCGSWGRNHARVYRELESSELVAVADIDEVRARAVGERYGVEWFTDIERVLRETEVEAISICTPTVTHAEIAMRCIEYGKHILVEKPLTNTLEEASSLIKAAERMGVHLSVGFVERFNPAVTEAMKLTSKGEIGMIILANARRVSRRPLRIGDVGVIKDLAIHDIDVTLQIFGEDPLEVYAIAGSIAHRFEDYANIMLRFKDNRNAFIEANWLTPKKVRNLTITGTEGIINIEYITQEITVLDQGGLYQPLIENQEPLKLELKSFVDSILRDEKPRPTGEEGLRTLKICEAALESARRNKPIRPQEIEDWS
ncbi:MAG: Gfo/Idh/MocA family oxidoreductase [Candidatus Bathyarchaeia archaeon]